MSKNYTSFLKLNTKKYKPGEYIVMIDGKVVAKGSDSNTLLRKAKKLYPKQLPFLAKMPQADAMVL